MSGIVALTGGSELHDGNEEQDRFLIEHSRGGPAYVLATANSKHPDMAVSMAQRWFSGLGKEIVELPVRSRQDANSKDLAEVQHYERVRQIVKKASGDELDMKSFEPGMRHLLDSYIQAQDSTVISEFGDLGLIELVVNHGVQGLSHLPKALRSEGPMAEAIENNIRKIILDETPVNPKYYERMSELLDALILERREKAMDYQEYLKQIQALATQVVQPAASSQYPTRLDTPAKRALYDNLEQREELALEIDRVVLDTKKDSWVGSLRKERELAGQVLKEVGPAYEFDVSKVMEIVKNQKEYQ